MESQMTKNKVKTKTSKITQKRRRKTMKLQDQRSNQSGLEKAKSKRTSRMMLVTLPIRRKRRHGEEY
jgi:hypothetical protein